MSHSQAAGIFIEDTVVERDRMVPGENRGYVSDVGGMDGRLSWNIR